MPKLRILGLSLIFIFASCRTSRILLSPVTENIQRIEGHASLSLSAEDQKARSKFSFAFELPDKGRISVSNFLGQTLYQILSVEGSSYFILPSKRVYWQGMEEEIFEKFLGFPLSLWEAISLFTGKWAADSDNQGWVFERDKQGRITKGRREPLVFRVGNFIGGTIFPEILFFSHPNSEGKVRMLRLLLNTRLPETAFDSSFLKRFSRKTWSEIEALLYLP
jgi:hypothetical protein